MRWDGGHGWRAGTRSRPLQGPWRARSVRVRRPCRRRPLSRLACLTFFPSVFFVRSSFHFNMPTTNAPDPALRGRFRTAGPEVAAVSSSTLGTNEGRGSMDQCTQPCWASGEARNRAGTAGRGGEREEAGVLVNVHHPPRHDSTRTKSRPEYQRCILQTTARWMHAVASPVCGILQYAPLLRRYMSAVRPCIG